MEKTEVVKEEFCFICGKDLVDDLEYPEEEGKGKFCFRCEGKYYDYDYS